MNEIENSRLAFPYDDSEYESNNLINDVKIVYSKLADEHSKKLFLKRFEISVTDDISVLADEVLSSSEGKKFIERFNRYNGNIYLYGCGIRAAKIVSLFKMIDWFRCIDKYKTGNFYGIPIVRINEIEISDDDCVLISNEYGYEDIYKDLIKRGFSGSQIMIMEDYNKEILKKQYFDRDIIKSFSNNGIMLDCGCYDGADTIRYIQDFSQNEDSYVICFEADSINADVCKRKLSNYKNVLIKNVALSDYSGVVRFNKLGNSLSSEAENGDSIVNTCAIDELTFDFPISFIKMDIEGGEYKALEGMRNTIGRDNPVLAISVYHRKWDIIRIAKLILSINPNYKLYVRHYSLIQSETILYAI